MADIDRAEPPTESTHDVPTGSFEAVYAVRGEFQSKVLQKVVDAEVLLGREGANTILDLGCGTGRHTVYLTERGYTVVGADLSGTGLRLARAKMQEAKLSSAVFIQSDLRSMAVADDSFDEIICVWTMGHGLSADVQKAVDEMARMVKPGGLVFTDFMSTDDTTFGHGRRLEAQTFVGSMPGEEHIIHHYSTRVSLHEMFQRYSDVAIEPVVFTYMENGSVHQIDALNVIAVR